MEEWIPLLDIFSKSPSPETQASLWLDEASISSSSSSSSSSSPINRSSFVSLLKAQRYITDQNSSPSSNKVMFIETLPNMVQSRIMSFLLYDYRRFFGKDLVWLAREMLGGGGGKEVDFWVQRGAQNLLDRMPERKFDWISRLDLGSDDDGSIRDEFDSVPDWLTEKKGGCVGTILPRLPVSCADVGLETVAVDSCNEEDVMSQGRDDMEVDHLEAVDDNNHEINVALMPDVHEMAVNLRARVKSCESTSEALALCDDIRNCLEKGRDCLRVLALVEPWNADDETTAVLLSNLHKGREEEEIGWPSQILCSTVLPKFLSLEKSASRVLMSATIEFCKIHQRAAEYGLVFPLILRKEGINSFICEVIARVLKECWHLGHISAFCQKLLCGRTEERKFVLLPCHRDLISDDLIWNESLFILFQNILIHDVPLTQGSVDCLVSKVQEMAERYCKSLKFGNFLLHFVAKCAPMLHGHKNLLIESVKGTNSLVTKSILSKLNAL